VALGTEGRVLGTADGDIERGLAGDLGGKGGSVVAAAETSVEGRTARGLVDLDLAAVVRETAAGRVKTRRGAGADGLASDGAGVSDVLLQSHSQTAEHLRSADEVRGSAAGVSRAAQRLAAAQLLLVGLVLLNESVVVQLLRVGSGTDRAGRGRSSGGDGGATARVVELRRARRLPLEELLVLNVSHVHSSKYVPPSRRCGPAEP